MKRLSLYACRRPLRENAAVLPKLKKAVGFDL